MNEQCPICNASHPCGIDDPTKPCWCTYYTFTEKMNEYLKTLPPKCICPSCAEKLGAVKKKEQA
ncbi:MAG: cysteine-rich CWC family protein [Bacilli bacterium]|nr:cysteine-rich CWC family protein [Bacilli bacterium]